MMLIEKCLRMGTKKYSTHGGCHSDNSVYCKLFGQVRTPSVLQYLHPFIEFMLTVYERSSSFYFFFFFFSYLSMANSTFLYFHGSFSSEARKSLNRPVAQDLLDNLIYNYKPTYCGYAG